MSRTVHQSDNQQLPLDPNFFQIADDALEEEISGLRADILRHLQALDLPSWAGNDGAGGQDKERIRQIHATHRHDFLERERSALRGKLAYLAEHIADGSDVCPERIDPELVPVRSDDPTGDAFRFATLFWSVPVSRGYGRRMRYLVRDRANGKLIGIFGLTDPVFNLRARDEWIGWTVEHRRARLVDVMDAYVVGAVPPYSSLLGGKLVASLIGSSEVSEAFGRRYAEKTGIISGQLKAARLALVTVTSALGRSSIYNRLKLAAPDGVSGARNLVELIRVGSTAGYGHFHLSEPLFRRLRRVVKLKGHHYADGHKYGQGPNWRIRLSRVGLGFLGLDPDLLRHGVNREIYVMPLAINSREYLCGQAQDACLDRSSAKQISDAALERWVLPRAVRYPEYASFRRSDIAERIS